MKAQLGFKFLGAVSSLSPDDLRLKEKGVYVFVLSGYPFYVGTASVSYSERIFRQQDSHCNLFETGRRTYFKSEFSPFLDSWPEHYISKIASSVDSREFIYVPGLESPDLKYSKRFFNNLGLLLLPIADNSLHKPIEKCIQVRVLRQYARLSNINGDLSEDELKKLFCIPSSRSTLLGKQEACPIYDGGIPEFPSDVLKIKNI